jgi:hypothetical protein
MGKALVNLLDNFGVISLIFAGRFAFQEFNGQQNRSPNNRGYKDDASKNYCHDQHMIHDSAYPGLKSMSFQD